MKILFEIPQEITEITNKSDMLQELSSYVKSEFNGMLDDGDSTYVRDIEEGCYILGSEAPKKIHDIAKSWNANIRKEAFEAIEALLPFRNTLPIDTPATYRLKVAALALDNSFYPFADYLVIVANEFGHTQMQPVLPKQMEAFAIQTPERFCVVDVFPK